MEIRPATRDDIVTMAGRTFPETIRALAVEHAGEVIAIAGLRLSDPKMAFSDIKPEIKKSPRTVVELIRRVKDMISDYESAVYAIADEDEPTAPGLLEHMGFRYFKTTRQGRVYQWHR